MNKIRVALASVCLLLLACIPVLSQGFNGTGVGFPSVVTAFSQLTGSLAVNQLPASTVDATGASSGLVPVANGSNGYAWGNGGAQVSLNNQQLITSGIAMTTGPSSAAYTSILQGKPAQSTLVPNEQVEYTVPTSSSGPSWICEGPDVNLWFTENSTNKIAKLTDSGTFTEFTITTRTNSAPNGICTGPDGALWFSETNLGPTHGNHIGRITTSGTVTDFQISSSTTSAPYLTCAGPDGNIWFTEINSGAAGQIGRCTTAGVITLFSNASLKEPEGICAGPDGNIWAVDESNNNVIRITPAGVMTFFPAPGSPVAFGNLTGICAGPDGALWFTDQNNNSIGRCTTSGVITEFVIPTSTSTPQGICAGPDGNIWFTEEGTNKVGVCTTSGVITEFVIPTSTSEPFGICVGGAGNLWYCEANTNKIGALVLLRANGANAFAGPVKSIAGSAGTLNWSMPEQGQGYKKWVASLSGYTAAGTTAITFPTAFTRTPSVTANGTTLATPTVSTTTCTIPISTTQTGTIEVSGMMSLLMFARRRRLKHVA